MSSATESDTGLGLAMVFGALALGSAVYMLLAGSQAATAYGFAAAVVLAIVSVAATHLYWG